MTDQITVLRNGGNDFTVIFERCLKGPQIVHRLGFDEMLGLVVKLMIPFHDNEPIFSPRQLFLRAPNEAVTRAEEQERVDNETRLQAAESR